MKLRLWLLAIIAVLLYGLAIFSGQPRAAGRVDVALVLAVDASNSIDSHERQLQREGYAAALTSPEVVGVIQAGRAGAIAVTLFEWGSQNQQVTVVPWTVVDGPASAAWVAGMIRGHDTGSQYGTSISGALTYAAEAFAKAPPAARQVIDVSGDGVDRGGEGLLEPARDKLLRAGVTINGLAILDPDEPMPVDRFYEERVIGGENAFVVVTTGFEDLARAVRIKLVTEIAGRMPATRFAAIGD